MFALSGIDNVDLAGNKNAIVPNLSSKKSCYLVQGLLRGGEPDANKLLFRNRRQPLNGKGEMHSSLIVAKRVDLIDNNILHALENLPGLLRRQHQVERFGRCNQNVRWTFGNGSAFGLRRIARSYCRVNRREFQSGLLRVFLDAGKRKFEVPLDVIVQCFQWGDVENANTGLEFFQQVLFDQMVDCPKECGKSLAGSCRRKKKRVPTG